MLSKILDALNYINDKISQFAAWLADLLASALASLLDILKDAIVWAFGQVLDLVIAVLNLFDFSALLQWVGTWSQLPAGVLEVLAAIGLGTCFGIIATAIGIRLLLQAIPFVRFGS